MSDVMIQRRWHAVAEVAQMLGYGESKVRMAILSGDLKSFKDGRSIRILPQGVEAFVAQRAAEAERRMAVVTKQRARHNGEGSTFKYPAVDHVRPTHLAFTRAGCLLLAASTPSP